MKKLIVLFALASLTHGQQVIYGDRTIEGNLVVNGARTAISKGTSLPATCTIGDMFFKTNGTTGAKVYGCETTNTWVAQGTIGGAGLTSISGESGGAQSGPGITLAKVNDTNIGLGIVGSGNTFTYTMSWIGTLAKARMAATTVHADQINTFGAGFQQSFAHNGTGAGFKLVPVAGNPSSFSNGDMWFNLTTGKYKCVEASTIVDCIGSGGGGSGITSLGGLTGATQTFVAVDDTNIDLQIVSSGTAHTFTVVWLSTLAKARQHSATAYIDQANSYTAGMRQSFVHNTTNAGIRLIPAAGAPTSPLDGDMWYSTDTSSFKCRENGITQDCITSPGGGITSLGGLTGATQTFAAVDDTNIDLQIVSSGTAHTFTVVWLSTLSKARQHAATVYNDQVNAFLASISGPLTTITPSATPVLDLGTGFAYSLTMAASVTSWTINNAPSGTATFPLIFIQDATGGRTVATPTGFIGFETPDPNPSAVWVQVFTKAGSSYYGHPGKCMANCSSGFVTYLGKTSGSTKERAADVAGTPNDRVKPIATAAVDAVLVSDGGNPQQESWSLRMKDLAGNGLYARTGTGAGTARTMTCVSNETVCTNGDGVAGNPTVGASDTIDLGSKTSTAAHKKGTSLPATCAVGQSYQKTDASAASQWYLCTATNTWTAQGGSGGLSVVGPYLYDGTTYYLGPTMTVATPPVVADWTTFGAAGTLTAVNSTMTVDIPASSAATISGWTVAEPGATYNCTLGIMPGLPAEDYRSVGMFWTDTTKLATLSMTAVSTTGPGFSWAPNKWTDSTHYDGSSAYTPDATIGETLTGYHPGGIIWMRLSKTSTDRISWVTFNNGITWKLFHTVAKNDYLTTTRLGFFGDDSSRNIGFKATVVSWKCVTP